MMKGVNYKGIATGKAVERQGAGKKMKMKESNDSSVSEQKIGSSQLIISSKSLMTGGAYSTNANTTTNSISTNLFDSAISSSSNNDYIKSQSKTMQLYNVKLKKIDASIEDSRQQIAKHMKLTRSLEKAKKQTMAIEQGLQLRIAKSLGMYTGKYEKYLKMIDMKEEVNMGFHLYDRVIYLIEQSCYDRIMKEHQYMKDPRKSFPNGIGGVIYKAYKSYEDKDLDHIYALVERNIGSDMLLDALFHWIDDISDQSISRYDFNALYHRFIQHAFHNVHDSDQNFQISVVQQLSGEQASDLNSISSQSLNTKIPWNKMISMLQKRLLLLTLTKAILWFLQNQPQETFHFDTTLSPSSSSASASVINSSISKHNNLNSQGKSAKTPLKSINSTQKVISDQNLNETLEKSRLKASNLQHKILSSISSMYGTELVPVDMIRHHKKALLTFQKLAVEKLFVSLEKIYEKFKHRMFERWEKTIEIRNIDIICQSFLIQSAAYQLQQVLELSVVKQLVRAFKCMKDATFEMRQLKQLYALMDIQRCWRGSRGRKIYKSKLRLKASIIIQSAMRMKLGKKSVQRIKKEKLLQRNELITIQRLKSNKIYRSFKKYSQIYLIKINTLILQRIYRGHRGRSRFEGFRLIHRRNIGALAFQTLVRTYLAKRRVRQLLLKRRQLKCALLIQTTFRQYLACLKVSYLKKLHNYAKVIQYLFLRYMAYKEKLKRIRIKSAIIIQSVIRGKFGRKRYNYFYELKITRGEALWNAIKVISPIILGYIIRKRWIKKIKVNSIIRNKNAIIIQTILCAIVLGQKARKKVKQIRKDKKILKHRNYAAIEIQRIQRGIIGRMKFKNYMNLWLIQQERIQNRLPYYYRYKYEYYRTQNLFHRKYIVKIQCAIRIKLARLHVKQRRYFLAARKIQKMIRNHVGIKKAKIIIERRKSELHTQGFSIVGIQKIIRGFLIRRRLHKLRNVGVLKWFLFELRLQIITREAMKKFKAYSDKIRARNRAATTIQKILLGRKARLYIKRNYKKLIRMRALRIREKRHQSAIILQCMVRSHRAWLIVKKKRLLIEERLREQKEFEELEASLKGMHEQFIHELYHIRAQTGARALLAKKEFLDKIAKHKNEILLKELRKKDDAAIKIQALIRGVYGRVKHNKNLPILKKALRARQICVECELQIAVRRCRNCKDRYCVNCYDKLHAKGNRRSHGWDRLAKVTDATTVASSKAKMGDVSSVVVKSMDNNKATRRQDWEEFYDESMRAKYWYNTSTGEASWVKPY